MQPNSGENQPQFEIPRPTPEDAADAKAIEKGGLTTPENQPQKQSLQATRQAISQVALPGQAVTVGDDSAARVSQPNTDNNAQAQDTDRIEKQWIDRVQAVVAKTQDDPFEQKKAVSKVAADYQHKRFKRTTKTEDTTTR